MEWWYIAGFLTTSATDEKFAFVSGFFSYSEHRRHKPGHMLVSAIMRLPSERIATVSLIDKELRASAFVNLRRIVERGRAHEYAKAYYESLKRCEVPRPHKVADNSSFDYSDLFAQIGPNYLVRRGAGECGLHLEDENCVLELDTKASKPAMLNGDNGILNLGLVKMNYYSYPRIEMSGLLSFRGRNLKVSGLGWLDHQWGDWLRFRDELFEDTRKSNPIAWHWFGIQLNNNLEINAYIPKHSIAGRSVKASITASLQSGQTMGLRGIEMRSHSTWQSLRTLKIYPVGWTIKAPDLDLSLEMESVVLMELPIFGPTLSLSLIHI